MRLALCVLAILCFVNAQAQIFWSEDFGSGCNQGTTPDGFVGSNGSWYVEELGGSNPLGNTWFVSAIADNTSIGNCADSCGANPSLHVSNPIFIGIDPDQYFGYANAVCFTTNCDVTTKRAASPVINCNGKTNITLSFSYIEGGEGLDDNATLWYYDGTNWSLLDDPAKTVACGSHSGIWTPYTTTLPASANNNPNVQIAFLWVNDGDTVRNDPSFAVDDIVMSAASSVCASSINVVNEISCYGDCNGWLAVDLQSQVGTGPFSYQWSNGSSDFELLNVCAENYSVTVTDALGCTSLSNVALTQPTMLGANALVVQNATCYQCENGEALANVTGGTPPFSLFWSNGETTNPAVGFNPGVFALLVVDANGCEATDTVEISDLSLGVDLTWFPFLDVYPNPVKNFLTLVYNAQAVDVEVWDATGRICLHKYLRENDLVDVSSLPSGFYFVRVNATGNDVVRGCFIKD